MLDGDLSVGFFAGFVIDDGQDVAIVEFTAIHDVVELGVVTFEHDKLAWAAVWQLGEDTATHDASVVQNNEIAWLEKISQFSIFAVGNFASLAIEGEQASSAADFWRLAGDAFVW